MITAVVLIVAGFGGALLCAAWIVAGLVVGPKVRRSAETPLR